MLRYLLDTNHFTHIELGHADVITRFREVGTDSVGILLISLYECMKGRLAQISKNKSERIVKDFDHLASSFRLLSRFSADNLILPYSDIAHAKFDELRAQYKKVGTQDLRIAAIAIVNEVTLVTHNSRDFAQIEGLRCETWINEPAA